MIYIAGTGIGLKEHLSPYLVDILGRADIVMGFRNSLEAVKDIVSEEKVIKLNIFDALTEDGAENIVSTLRKGKNSVFLVSGTPVLFSYGALVMKKLDKSEYEIVPAVSSIFWLASKVKVAANNIAMVSGHNSRDINSAHTMVLRLLREGMKIGYFVKNEEDFNLLIERLHISGNFVVHGGYELGTVNERVYSFDVDSLPKWCPGRWVLLIESEEVYIPTFVRNDDLLRDAIPISREWTRAIVVQNLDVNYADVVWDVGAGSGATSIWLANFLRHKGKIYAIERSRERFEILMSNVKAYPNIVPVCGDISDVVDELPIPDRVHFGGGITAENVKAVLGRMKRGSTFVASLCSLESLKVFMDVKEACVDFELFSRHSMKNLKGKNAFRGEMLFILVRGVRA